MAVVLVDRVSRYPGRVLITPENGGEPFYAIMSRADEPYTEGTPLNASTLNELVKNSVLPATVE